MERQWRALNIYTRYAGRPHYRKESRGCSRRQRIQERLLRFPFPRFQTDVSRIEPMKISPALVLSPRVVKLSFDGEVVLTIVCGKGLKLESFSYRKKEIIIVMIPSFDTFFFLQRHKWRYKTTSMRAFENISDGGNRFLTITKWPLPLSATPPFPLPVQLFRVKRNIITWPLFILRQVLLIGEVAGELKSQRGY